MAKKRFSDGAGPSQRQLRVAEVIRRRLSEILSQGEIHDPELNQMSITVGEVRVTPDLRIATAFVLPLGGRDVDAALELLARNKSEIRRAVSRGVSLKFSAEIRFMADETYDRLDATRRLFSQSDVRRDLDND